LYTLTIGAHRSTVKEQMNWVNEYPIEWRKPPFDLAELARLRWIKGLSIKELAQRFGKSKSSIDYHLKMIKKKNFNLVGLTYVEREMILGGD